MPKVIVFRQKGDWKKSRKFLKRCSNLSLDELLDRYGQEGVEALAKATPKDTGKTAASWSYTVTKGKESICSGTEPVERYHRQRNQSDHDGCGSESAGSCIAGSG